MVQRMERYPIWSRNWNRQGPCLNRLRKRQTDLLPNEFAQSLRPQRTRSDWAAQEKSQKASRNMRSASGRSVGCRGATSALVPEGSAVTRELAITSSHVIRAWFGISSSGDRQYCNVPERLIRDQRRSVPQGPDESSPVRSAGLAFSKSYSSRPVRHSKDDEGNGTIDKCWQLLSRV
jgi:hypothetical protein